VGMTTSPDVCSGIRGGSVSPMAIVTPTSTAAKATDDASAANQENKSNLSHEILRSFTIASSCSSDVLGSWLCRSAAGLSADS
jgi:hypothetical protein